MLSFRAVAARFRAFPALSTSSRRPITTREHDKRKRPSLIDNAPGWNEDLATTSEAFVKADQETTTIDKMKEKTVNYVQSHHHDPEIEQTHATYAREEIGGPLGNAGVGEFEGVVGKDDLGPDDTQIESNGRVVTRRVVREKTTIHEDGSGPAHANNSV